MELDEKLRSRLRALAEQEHGLDEAARMRVRAKVLVRDPVRHAGRWFLWVALPAVAALLAWSRFEAVRPQRPQLVAVPGQAQASGTAERAQEASSAALECARDADDPRALPLGTLHASSLELARALIVQGRASLLAVQAYDGCELGLALARGEVAVHARALRGGSLWIESPLGRVQVRGTVFSVALEARRLRIAVAEGTVAVSRGEHELAQVTVDQVLELSADGTLVRRALPERERGRLLAQLSLAPQRERRPPGAQLSVSDAGADETGRERVWRGGAVPAFLPEQRDVPSSVQPDGRPMQKPRLVE